MKESLALKNKGLSLGLAPFAASVETSASRVPCGYDAAEPWLYDEFPHIHAVCVYSSTWTPLVSSWWVPVPLRGPAVTPQGLVSVEQL